MNILGIHDGHNASAALLSGRTLVRMVQEERFSGLKNHGGFPARAIAWILADTGVRPEDLDAGGTTRSMRTRARLRGGGRSAPGAGVRPGRPIAVGGQVVVQVLLCHLHPEVL
jgi:hypothetical protein